MKIYYWIFFSGLLMGGLVDYSDDQDMIIIGSQDGSIYMITLAQPKMEVIHRLDSPVTDLGFGPEEESLYYSNQSGYLFFHDLDGSSRLKPRKASAPPIYSVTTAFLGDQILYVSESDCITKCNYSGGYLIQTIKTPRIINRVVCLSHFGKYFLAAGNDTDLRIYQNDEEYSLIRSINMGGSITVIAFAYDDQHFICGDRQGTIYIYELFNFTELKQKKVHDQPVRFVCFSMDNNYFLSGGNKSVYLWNLAKKTTIMSPLMHEVNVIGGGFIPTRDLIFTVTEDKQIIFWDRYILVEKFRLLIYNNSLICVTENYFEWLSTPKEIDVRILSDRIEKTGLYSSLMP